MNFGDILKKAKENGGFEVLPEGPYVAKIIEASAKLSSTGKPQIKTRWEVVAGPHAGFKGLWNYFTLSVDSEKALGIFYSQLAALGITSDFLDSLGSVDIDTAFKHIAASLEGKVGAIKVVVDKEWNNNKIDRISKAPVEYQNGAASAPGGFAAPSAPAAPPSTPF